MMESRESSRPILSAGGSPLAAADKTNVVNRNKKALLFRALIQLLLSTPEFDPAAC
jgi:hypothetical protein